MTVIKNNKMKKFKIVIIAITWAFISFSCLAQQRPNIVLIMADDLGGRDLPVYGNQFNEAPNYLCTQDPFFDFFLPIHLLIINRSIIINSH